jgi:Flp pilus assembly pilin Flp
MLKRLKSLCKDERGLTTVEWAVLTGIVAAIAVAGGVVIRSGITSATGTINNNLNTAVSGASTITNW